MGTLTSTLIPKSFHMYAYTATLTPSGGDVSDDVKVMGGSDLIELNSVLKQVIVKAATSTTTFDFGIFHKSDDFPIWTKTGNTGYFNDAREFLAGLVGEFYVKIENASVDEAIMVKLIWK